MEGIFDAHSWFFHCILSFTAGKIFEKNFLFRRELRAIKDGYLNDDLENWLYFLVVISIGLLMSFRTLYLCYLSSNNRYKKISWVIIAFLFCCIAQCLFNYFHFGPNSPVFYGFISPFSILISNFILNAKSNWLPNTFHWHFNYWIYSNNICYLVCICFFCFLYLK